jgi:hypothetical protein
MREIIRNAFDQELAAALRAEGASAFEQAWLHFERAHILSQAYAWQHLLVHARMFGFAWRRRDVRELIGQLPRLALAAPGSWTGRAPHGNTGGADVGIFTPMEVPPDLRDLIEGKD